MGFVIGVIATLLGLVIVACISEGLTQRRNKDENER
jgi:hypothetical protein